jgi:hypothetical protein
MRFQGAAAGVLDQVLGVRGLGGQLARPTFEVREKGQCPGSEVSRRWPGRCITGAGFPPWFKRRRGKIRSLARSHETQRKSGWLSIIRKNFCDRHGDRLSKRRAQRQDLSLRASRTLLNPADEQTAQPV